MNAQTSSAARRVFAALAALLTVASPAHAQRDRYLPLILQLPTDARSSAMGNASLALDAPDAVFRNPSFVGQNSQMSLSFARYSPSATAGSFTTGAKVGAYGIGFGVQFLDYTRNAAVFSSSSDALTLRDISPASSLAATLAVRRTWKDILWGASAKYVEERGALAKDGTSAFDLGASKDLGIANLTAALAVQNLGTGLSMRGLHVQLPQRYALGVQGGDYSFGKWIDASFVGQLAVRRDGVVLPAGGGELRYEPLEGIAFALRAGARRPELHEERPLTVGAGFSLDRFTIDYAWEQLRTNGAHRITLRMR